MELRALRVEVEILHANYKVEMNARRARGPGILNCGNSTNCAGAKNIAWSDQVVGVPLDIANCISDDCGVLRLKMRDSIPCLLAHLGTMSPFQSHCAQFCS